MSWKSCRSCDGFSKISINQAQRTVLALWLVLEQGYNVSAALLPCTVPGGDSIVLL